MIMPRNKNRLHPLYRLLMVAAAIIVVIIFVIIALKLIHNKQIRDDRARFTAAEQEVNLIAQKIVAVNGKPLKSEITKSCSRPNLKFETGPLSCDISLSEIRAVSDNYSANNYVTTAKDLINDLMKPVNNEGNQAFTDLKVQDYIKEDYHQIQEDYVSVKGLNCKYTADFYLGSVPPFSDLKVEYGSKYGMYSNLNCSDFSKAQYYLMN